MKAIDRPLLILTVILVVIGFFIFSSASLGLLARQGAQFSSVAFSQFFFGIVLGGIALFAMSKIRYRVWKNYAPHIFILSIIATLLVFIPHIGFEANGAQRWISLFGFTLQPAEFLKLGVVLYLAAFFSSHRAKITEFRYGLLPLILTLAVAGFILLLQPDTGTFLVIASAGIAIYIAAGGTWRDFGILLLVGILALGALIYQRPYLKDRIETFVRPDSNLQDSGYQLNQALIAVGSGEVFGRGFGKSVQKFNYLPEPIGDSIFAVAAEEFGFIGALFLTLLFFIFALRGFRIGARAPDYFSGLLVTGIIILIISQSFINIGSMLGVFPLTGLPLVFISHGGTAMLFALASVGIVLNVSKYIRA